MDKIESSIEALMKLQREVDTKKSELCNIKCTVGRQISELFKFYDEIRKKAPDYLYIVDQRVSSELKKAENLLGEIDAEIRKKVCDLELKSKFTEFDF